MKQIVSFDEFLVQLEPTLGELREKQMAEKKKASKRAWILSSIDIAIMFIAIYYEAPLQFILLCIFILLFGFVFIFSPSSRLKEFYKKEVVSNMVKLLVDKGRYEPNNGIPETVFMKSGLFRQPDRYKTEDLISGQIDKTSFRFAEIHAEEKIQSGKSTSWRTLFKGFFFIADFHKDFKGKTLVTRDSLLKWKSGRVKLENPEFEELFDVFSTDQIEARYILTPSMMERLIHLDEDFGGDIVISFCDSHIIIAIPHSQDHFEVPLSHQYTTDRMFADYEMITSLISIVDDLNLNTRIWTKK